MDASAFITTFAAAAADEKSFVDYLPLAGAGMALLGALAVAAWNQYQNRADRRRDMYSGAYRAALTWVELYYRVRRRDPENPHELVVLFHKAQEDIDYHQGWLTTESATLGQAYANFVSKIKTEARPLIQKAWREPPCSPEDGLIVPDDEHPKVEDAKRQFLADVSDHLSLSIERRVALKDRYPR